jgi:ubiquitin-like-conjugating enzyme ATG10
MPASIASLPIVIPCTITPPITDSPTAGRQAPGGSIQFSEPEVLYEIHLHPTYRVPTLWFSLNYLPDDEQPWDIDVIIKYLVPVCERKKVREGKSSTVISMAVSISYIESLFHRQCKR